LKAVVAVRWKQNNYRVLSLFISETYSS
jgi:hypothetical protein